MDRREGVTMVINCLHVADLHLGYVPRLDPDRSAALQGERDGLLDRLSELVRDRERGINLVVVAGDLFETHRPDAGLVRRVTDTLGEWVRAGVTVITVPGNHDEITYHDSVFRRGDWPGILVTSPSPELLPTLDIAGMRVHVCSLAYTGGITPVRDLSFPPRSGDGLWLGAFHGSLDWDAGDRSLPITSAQLAAAGYDYAALGHIHQPQSKRVGRGLALYPGAIAGKGFDDSGCGEATIVGFGRGAASVRKVALPLRRWVTRRVDLTACAGQDEAAAACTDQTLKGDCVRLALSGAPGFVLDRGSLFDALSSQYWHLELEDELSWLDEAAIGELAEEPTVRGEFVRRMRERSESACDERERGVLSIALRRGLAALQGGGRR